MTHFGTTKGGKDIDCVTLSAGDIAVKILTLGAIVQDVRLAGVAYGLALGSDKVADYEAGMKYFGAIVGPIANRISNSRVRLDGMMYELERNEKGRTHLHSGAEGSHAQIWTIVAQTQTSVTLTLTGSHIMLSAAIR
ncbi:MAG: galactose mutarotase, partial [Paracoccaceae bacterium]|nr:galactose mutarotase [Paracoccaceae bacterium]